VSSGVALRNSVGPSAATPFSREPKARKDALAKQLPLQEGRKVAFHPPAGKPGEATDADENTWILAVVTKCFSQDKNRLVWFSFVLRLDNDWYLDMKYRTQNLKKTDNLDSK